MFRILSYSTPKEETQNSGKPEFFKSLKMGLYLQLLYVMSYKETIYDQIKLLCKGLLTSTAITFCSTDC